MTKENRPLIVKRKKIIAGGAHHGGAWKVAYADFVTAMMAFFMLMWLLNATTEQQRKGIADYFAPTIAINRISGGGEGSLGGETLFATQAQARNATGGIGEARGSGLTDDPEMNRKAAEIESLLQGFGGESTQIRNAMQHIVTRVTDQGLVIEIFDRPESQLFIGESAVPTPTLPIIADLLTRVLADTSNDIALTGHLRSKSDSQGRSQIWPLSAARAERLRLALETAGFDMARLQRLTGEGDRRTAVPDRASIRNDRLEIVLLRPEN